MGGGGGGGVHFFDIFQAVVNFYDIFISYLFLFRLGTFLEV